MEPRINMITLGIEDLERSLRFYRDGLGLATEGVVGQEFEHGAVVFFDLQHGMRLALWAKRNLAHDTGIAQGKGDPTAFCLAHNVGSKEEVDVVMDAARAAGATVVKPAADAFWGGYSGYFQDPDGHLWEVAWNPEWATT